MSKTAVVVLMVLALGVGVSAELVGWDHRHCNALGDDGTQSMLESVEAPDGIDFEIITPHIERVGSQIDLFVGFLRPLVAVVKKVILLAPESGVVKHPLASDPDNRLSHFSPICANALNEGDGTLAWLARVIASDGAKTLEGAPGTIYNIVERYHSLGGVVIANHPTNPLNPMSDDLLACGFDGMEVMYTGGVPLDEAIRFSRFADPPLPIPGRDDHGEKTDKPESVATANISDGASVIGPTNIGYLPNSERYTVLVTDDNSPEGIVAALRERREYAAFGPGRIKSGRELLGQTLDPNQPFEMTFSGVKGVMAWIVWHAKGGREGVKEVLMRDDTVRIDSPREWLPEEMAGGGWISVWAPAVAPLIIPSGIVAPAYEDSDADPKPLVVEWDDEPVAERPKTEVRPLEVKWDDEPVAAPRPVKPAKPRRPKGPSIWGEVGRVAFGLAVDKLLGGGPAPDGRSNLPATGDDRQGATATPAAGTIRATFEGADQVGDPVRAILDIATDGRAVLDFTIADGHCSIPFKFISGPKSGAWESAGIHLPPPEQRYFNGVRGRCKLSLMRICSVDEGRTFIYSYGVSPWHPLAGYQCSLTLSRVR